MADDFTINGTTIPGGIPVRGPVKGGKIAQTMTLDLGGAGTEKLATGFLPAGALAVNMATDPAAVAGGSEIEQLSDVIGRIFVINGHPNLKRFQYRGTGPINGYSVQVPTSGHRLVLMSFNVTTPNSNSGDIDMMVGLGTADGTVYNNIGLPGNRTDQISGQHIPAALVNDPLKLTVVDPTGIQQYACFGTYYELPS